MDDDDDENFPAQCHLTLKPKKKKSGELKNEAVQVMRYTAWKRANYK